MGYAEHFSIANIPFGIASRGSHSKPAPVTRLEDTVFFLADLDLPIDPAITQTFSHPTLNALAALPKSNLRHLRATLQTVLTEPGVVSAHGVPLAQVQMHLPVSVGGFTDFSCSTEHLLNASEAMAGVRSLPPAALHFPVGYGARASSVVVSGTPIARPLGQYYAPDDGEEVVFGPSQAMDYELEMGAIVGPPSTLGEPVAIGDADEHIFGVVLLNDWSARDIQKLEMRPLGPLNGKSFGTTMSPWVVTLEALAPFACAPPPKEFEPKPYLQDKKAESTYDVALEVDVSRGGGRATSVCTARQKWMYWTFRDLVAQQTVNGCSLSTGDVLGTGTVSGVGDGHHGCLLELKKAGGVAPVLAGGEPLVWLRDGDEVRLSGYAGAGVGFGECTGVLKPSRALYT
ncbi:fumarylacetoacetase [Coniochaeta ligniaria NRRL 30616]|uniref:Fumarylacetoacetase n=1 Tax=Coniochaeta ligniaria NRRL 30616 TaxID=1408157 RepID=A0A1J7IQW0_9PEZI|nr:fumarylacetoacetase [Coniochaeta ligniaria NRRL 30616]